MPDASRSGTSTRKSGLTAEEVAKEIRTWLGKRWIPAYPDERKQEIDFISQALTAYAEERVREAIKATVQRCDDMHKFEIDLARASGLEEAAKVCEALGEKGESYLWDASGAIRALKAKP